MKYLLIILLTIIGVETYFLAIIFKPAKVVALSHQSDVGNLKVVAAYQPLNLKVYADTDSTNKAPDFGVGVNDQVVFLKETEPNNLVVITHVEKSIVTRTEYNIDGEVLRCFVDFNYSNDINRMKYAYIDTNGDGLFDLLIQYDVTGKRIASFLLNKSSLNPMAMTNRN